jgi:hypothetical protein
MVECHLLSHFSSHLSLGLSTGLFTGLSVGSSVGWLMDSAVGCSTGLSLGFPSLFLLKVLENQGRPTTSHLFHHSTPGVAIFITHFINLSAALLYVIPEASKVLCKFRIML